MPWAIAILMFALWALGLVSGAALGGWLHLFLVSAAICLALGATASSRDQGAPHARN